MVEWRKSPKAFTLSPFARAVYEVCSLIPEGKLATYGTLAQLLEGASAQAVGSALGKNPFAPTVPCHRVIKGSSSSHYSLGGFSGQAEGSGGCELDKKQALLLKEGIRFDPKSLRLLSEAAVIGAADFPAEAVKKILQEMRGGGRGKSSSAAAAAPAATKLSGSKRSAAEAGAGASAAPSSAAAAPVAKLRAELGAAGATGSAVRAACRDGSLDGHTSGLAPGYAQANLVIVPKEHAFDFLLFCTRNPKPCPLLEVTEVGNPEAPRMAPGCDIRKDLPRYRVYKEGKLVEELTDITHLWKVEQGAGGAAAGGAGEGGKKKGRKADGKPAAGAADASSSSSSPHPDCRSDWVAFLLGCSFSFEEALLNAEVPVRHLQEEKDGSTDFTAAPAMAKNAKNVPMYRTSIACENAGVFRGPLVVSMRPMTAEQRVKACRITEEFPRVHGR